MALLNYLKFINRYKKLSRICRARGPGPQMSTRASYGQHSGLSCHLLALLMHNRALRSVTLCHLCPSSSPLREKENLWEFQLLHFRHHSLPWPQGPSARLKIYGQAHWGAAPALPFFWILSVFCRKETQEDVSSVDCMWQCLLLSQESEAWWINCQPWRMMFSPYFHYEPGCHLLINFVHWYQFIFTSRGLMYLGKALTADLAQLDSVAFTSFWKATLVPRTELDPQPLRRRRKKYKSLCERKRHPWGKFLLLSQNKSSLEDYHDIILFLRQPCKARWETPLLVTS